MSEKVIKIKEKKPVNPYLLLFCGIVVMAVLTWIVPAGQFERVDRDGRMMVVSGTYESMPNTPVGFLDIFSSLHTGLVEAGEIIFYLLLIGGTIAIMTKTGAMDAFLKVAARKFAKKRILFVAVMVLLFSLGGSFVGMAEEALIYVPIVVPIALALGYDIFTGVAIVVVGMGVGFTTAVMNPFTVGIAQGVAELPMFSGLWLRLVIYICTYLAFVFFIYRHGEKVRKNHSLGVWGDGSIVPHNADDDTEVVKIEVHHKLTLLVFLAGIVSIVIGVMKFDWYLGEYAAVFVIMAVLMAFINKLGVDGFIKVYLEGASDMIGAAIVIGLARGIVVVATNGNIIDTVLHSAADLLAALPTGLSVVGMFFIQGIIHILVPSGSGQAMLTMPILAPLGDILGITRQTTTLIFTLCGGTGDTWIPTYGALMAILSMMKIPYSKWIKNLLPWIIGQYIVYIIVCIVANKMGYGPF